MTAPVHCRRLHDGDPPEPVLDDLLASLGGLASRVGPGDRVLIKPNFVAPFAHATTDLAFIAFFVESVRRAGAEPLVAEASGYEFDTVSTFQVLGVRRLVEELGVEVKNLDAGPFRRVDLGDGLGPVEMAVDALDAAFIINLPVLKGHSITRMTGAVKNSFGLIDRASRRGLHSRRLEAGIAAVSRRLPPALHVVDARRKLKRAVFADSEPLGYVLAGEQPFALDHLGAQLLGIEPEAIGHLDRVPSYEVLGDAPRLGSLERVDSLKARVHRAAYTAFYWLDEQKTERLGGRSIIHGLHWYLGIHPELVATTDAEAAAVAESCPVDAIDVARRTIVKERCQTVRCLACFRQHPQLVRLGGLNRPRNLKGS